MRMQFCGVEFSSTSTFSLSLELENESCFVFASFACWNPFLLLNVNVPLLGTIQTVLMVCHDSGLSIKTTCLPEFCDANEQLAISMSVVR